MFRVKQESRDCQDQWDHLEARVNQVVQASREVQDHKGSR